MESSVFGVQIAQAVYFLSLSCERSLIWQDIGFRSARTGIEFQPVRFNISCHSPALTELLLVCLSLPAVDDDVIKVAFHEIEL